jgi:hypothetical protein
MRNRLPSRGHQRGSASAAAQAWLEKEIYVSNPSKNKFIRLSKSLSVYMAEWRCDAGPSGPSAGHKPLCFSNGHHVRSPKPKVHQKCPDSNRRYLTALV